MLKCDGKKILRILPNNAILADAKSRAAELNRRRHII